MTREAVEPLMVSPDAGVRVRVLVWETAPKMSITVRALPQPWPTQVPPALGRVQIRGAEKVTEVETFTSVGRMV